MKSIFLALSAAALLLTACNQTPPATSAPTATAPTTTATTTAATAHASATAPTAPSAEAAPKAAAPTPKEVATINVSFSFKPAPDADDPAHLRTSAHLLLQGDQPQDIDLGKFAGKPDLVDAAKAKAANFPAGMLLGFRSYSAATGTSADLAVLNEDGRHLRIVQRRVEETAPEAGKFETSREILLPADTKIRVAAPTKKARK